MSTIEKGDWIKVVNTDKKTGAKQVTEGTVTFAGDYAVGFGNHFHAFRQSTEHCDAEVIEHRKTEPPLVDGGIYELRWPDGGKDTQRYASGRWSALNGAPTVTEEKRKKWDIRVVRRVKIVDWAEDEA